VPGGVTVRYVGTQGIKNLLDSRLRGIQAAGAGYLHFPIAYPADYFEQVVAERREWRRDKTGHKALWWVKSSARNEAWDLLVYGYAAFQYLMSGRHAEVVWRDRERVFGLTPQKEMFDGQSGAEPDSQPQFEAIKQPEPAPPVPRRRLRSSFAKRWQQ
jgi:phage terminase large subunit GpA-like protein